MKSIIGYQTLEEVVERLGSKHDYTCLHICHSEDGGIDPDETFSSVPYEKGFNFLVYLEKLVGGPSVFEPFLKSYIQEYKLSTVTPMKFRNSFERYMLENGVAKEIVEKVDWKGWLYRYGCACC